MCSVFLVFSRHNANIIHFITQPLRFYDILNFDKPFFIYFELLMFRSCGDYNYSISSHDVQVHVNVFYTKSTSLETFKLHMYVKMELHHLVL